MKRSFSVRFHISHPAVYRIRIPGRLNPEWSDYLQGLTVSVIEENDQNVFTELSGLLPDQAALMGILQHLYSCAIPLLSVECFDICNPQGDAK